MTVRVSIFEALLFMKAGFIVQDTTGRRYRMFTNEHLHWLIESRTKVNGWSLWIGTLEEFVNLKEAWVI